MTINLALDLASFVEDAVRTGRYESANDVVSDALIRLRQVLELTTAATDESGEPVLQDKPLTKQVLQQHLVELGLVDEPTESSSGPPPIEDENEIISDIVIRERLIEWLVGFL
jgi:Arc/MetJ-type ribon-helix-helix transcriptional regulator